MSIRLKCPDCDKPLKAKDELAGKRIRCPGCQSVIRVPTNAAPADESATRKTSPTPAAEDDVPESWLTGDDGNSTADQVAPDADDYDVPPPSAALPPRVGKTQKGGTSQGAFVPVQGVSEPPKTSRQRSEIV